MAFAWKGITWAERQWGRRSQRRMVAGDRAPIQDINALTWCATSSRLRRVWWVKSRGTWGEASFHSLHRCMETSHRRRRGRCRHVAPSPPPPRAPVRRYPPPAAPQPGRGSPVHSDDEEAIWRLNFSDDPDEERAEEAPTDGDAARADEAPAGDDEDDEDEVAHVRLARRLVRAVGASPPERAVTRMMARARREAD